MMPAELQMPARIVVRAPNWLGDAVMALPAMAAVRRAFPASKLAVAAPASVSPIFEERTSFSPDEIIVLRGAVRESAAIRAGGFDAALLLPNSFGSAWQMRQAGVPERWGYGANLRGWMLTRSVARPKGKQHQSRYYLDLVRGL